MSWISREKRVYLISNRNKKTYVVYMINFSISNLSIDFIQFEIRFSKTTKILTTIIDKYRNFVNVFLLNQRT